MAKKRPELDVDFIDSRGWTPADSAAVSAFIQQQKAKEAAKTAKPTQQKASKPTKRESGLDFIVDQLTKSIVNVVSGESFRTEVLPLTTTDIKGITKKAGWNFNWKAELANNSRQVYKLTTVENPAVVQGLLSLEIDAAYINMHLLESAPFNIGKAKFYEGVAGNLVAYACRMSFQHGFDGYVGFIAKTKLIRHYQETLGATHAGGQRMFIETAAARTLVERYFKS